MKDARGFTLIELMVVVIVLGILMALGVHHYGRMKDRAFEASTRSNMHTFQLAAEDYGTRHEAYATDAGDVATVLAGIPAGSDFRNPFDRTHGDGRSWRDQSLWAASIVTGSTRPGIVAYSDSAGDRYQIAGRGRDADLPLILRGD